MASMSNIGGWKMRIPTPENTLVKLLSPDQRKKLDAFKDKYVSPKYSVCLIQMLSCD
jgi:hypothetical protein